MAYPTTLNYQISGPSTWIGAQAIDVTSSTLQVPLGTIVTARDVNYGPGEFIYLKGVGSTIAGSAVVYNVAAATTTLTTATTAGLVAIAMSANVANYYGWYQLTGEAIVSVAASVLADGAVSGLAATPGMLTPGVDGITPIYKATAKTATDSPTAGFAQIQIGRPWMSGFTTDVA
jgi:hypothetical protein